MNELKRKAMLYKGISAVAICCKIKETPERFSSKRFAANVARCCNVATYFSNLPEHISNAAFISNLLNVYKLLATSYNIQHYLIFRIKTNKNHSGFVARLEKHSCNILQQTGRKNKR